MNFASDNVTGIAPEVMAALMAINQGAAMPYGNDECTQRLESKFADLFEKEVAVFPVATGSAANALALSALTPPYGSIFCHAESHIYVDECGAPEFYSGGAKLIPLTGANGKIPVEDLAIALAQGGVGDVHHVQPAAVSITQLTEAGTVYSLAEVEAIAQLTHAHHLYLHMDGARFANAIVSLGCSPAELTWQAGVDVLSFGATKNGAMAAEAVIFFQPELAKHFAYRRKRGGHLFSKMRFLSAQLEAYLTDRLWLNNATHANHLATTLAQELQHIPQVELCFPVEGNELFVRFPKSILSRLLDQGFQFYFQENEVCVTARLVMGFNTPKESIFAFLEVLRAAATKC